MVVTIDDILDEVERLDKEATPCDQEGCGLVLLPGRSIFCPSAPRVGVGDVGIIRPHFGVAAMLDVRQCEGGVIVVNASRNAVLLREGMIVAEEVVFERADSAQDSARQERDEAKVELEALRRDLDETRRVHARISAVADRARQNLCDAMLKIAQERDEARSKAEIQRKRIEELEQERDAAIEAGKDQVEHFRASALLDCEAKEEAVRERDVRPRRDSHAPGLGAGPARSVR